MNIESIISITRFPISDGRKMSRGNLNDVGKGKQKFFYADNFIGYFHDSSDFLEEESEEDKYIYKKALETWGKNLHAGADREIPSKWHHNTLREHLPEIDLYNGKVILEIGCGEGFDLHNSAIANPSKVFIGLDLGENIVALANRDKEIKNLFYIRGDALQLPFLDNSIDSIVSYGVFHHTINPNGCMKEANRVLKKGGQLTIYLYKNHEDNLFKFLGCVLESLLMKITSSISHRSGKILCKILSPFILFFFSWPAQILKQIPFTRSVANKFPLHWGTTPNSILPDLEDRLLASINFRFSFKEFEKLFRENNFKELTILTHSSGHYGNGCK